jgi:hypothetical protein
LETDGYIQVVQAAGRRLPTEYALVVAAIKGDTVTSHESATAGGSGVTSGTRGVTSGALRGDIAVSPEPSKAEPSREPSEPTPALVPRASNGRARTPNDDLWDAFVEWMEAPPSNDGERGKWARAMKLARQSEVTPSEVPVLCEMYRRTYPRVDCNPLAVANHVAELRRNIRHGGPPSSTRDQAAALLRGR